MGVPVEERCESSGELSVNPEALELAIQNGCSKATPTPAAPAKLHVRYDQIHAAIAASFAKLEAGGYGQPDMLLAISGGGLIPARILRSVLRRCSNNPGCATIKVIGLELYSDELDGRPHEAGVKRTQWLDLSSTRLAGKRILIVDEVDDSRATLAYAVKELQADIAAQEAELAAAGEPVPPTHLAAFVIHNKLRPKKGQLPDNVPEFVAQELDGSPWIVYPWDAPDLEEHNALGSKH